jgi:hypothetical protein
VSEAKDITLTLTEWEAGYLARKVGVEFLVYLEHDARGGLKPSEKGQLERLRALNAKFADVV